MYNKFPLPLFFCHYLFDFKTTDNDKYLNAMWWKSGKKEYKITSLTVSCGSFVALFFLSYLAGRRRINKRKSYNTLNQSDPSSKSVTMIISKKKKSEKNFISCDNKCNEVAIDVVNKKKKYTGFYFQFCYPTFKYGWTWRAIFDRKWTR